jgi:hypothetical protein
VENLVIVFHHKHAIAAPGGSGLNGQRRGFLVCRGALRLRQIDGEGRAFAMRARHRDVAFGLLCEAEGLAKAEAGALADFLGGEERLEDGLDIVRRDAAAGVCDRDRDIVAAAR